MFSLQGSVVVFSNYSSWTGEDPQSVHYCHPTPMLFAFCLLLVKWLLLPAILLAGCITAACRAENTEQVSRPNMFTFL